MRESRESRSNVVGALFAGFVVVCFCLLLLRHDPLLFWNDDYELSILPVFADVARAWNEGHWPLLSSCSWVCSNLAGEFQYGTFSVFVNAAVVLIWKLPLAFPQQAAALSMAHLFVLAAGAFLLARGRAFDFPTSIFVALVAALNGWIMCWGATDWFGALGAFAWLPWAWWAMEKSLVIATPCSSESGERTRPRVLFSAPRRTGEQVRDREGAIARTRGACAPRNFGGVRFAKAALWPAPFVYLLITGGFPYAVVMLALVIGWLSIKSLVQTRRISSILPMLAGMALGVGLAAPAWLALFDYVRGSGREISIAAAHWQWNVPWKAWPALILPCWTVNWTDFSSRLMPHAGSELATGLAAPVIVISALVQRGREFVRRAGWELGLLVVVLVLCMIPTAGLFRWSFRWLPCFHLVLAICAGEALRAGDRRGLVALFLVGVVAVAMPLTGATGEFAFPFTWIVLGLAAAWFATESILSRPQSNRWIPAVLTFAVFLATYFCIPTNCGVPKYNLTAELRQAAPLDPDRLYLSIYPWAEITYRTENRTRPLGRVVRPGSTSMWSGLRFVNGYSPVLAAGVGREFKCSVHGEIDPEVAAYLLRDQAGPGGFLQEMGVDGIVIAPESGLAMNNPDWERVHVDDDGTVYHRRGPPLATVRSVTWLDSLPDREFVGAQISAIADSRNEVTADVNVPTGDAPALLKFSRPYFRGYLAKISGRRLPVASYRGLFPIVEVPAGTHGRLVLSYRPPWLVCGAGVAVLSVFACVLLFVRRHSPG